MSKEDKIFSLQAIKSSHQLEKVNSEDVLIDSDDDDDKPHPSIIEEDEMEWEDDKEG